MPNLDSLENVYLILGLVVPGLITLFVRSQFVTGRRSSRSDVLLAYFTVSSIYYALALPFFYPLLTIARPNFGSTLPWIVLIFVGPAALGLLLGVSAQKDLLRRCIRWCGLYPVHVVPTAWDWKFGRMTSQWVLVTLKDGTRFAGFCGPNSFVSSDPAERDIYVQWVYDVDDNGKWTSRGECSVLIAAGEIRTIEFWPYVPQETKDDQRSKAVAAPPYT